MRDSGSWTFQSSCRSVDPAAMAASMTVAGHGPDPDVDEPDDRRRGVDHRGDDGGEPARPEQRDRRDEVDERGHRLGGVEDRPQDGCQPVAPRAQDADDEADRQGDARRHEHGRERLHGVLPERGQEEQDEAGGGDRGRRRPEIHQRQADDHGHHQPPRGAGQDRLERIDRT